MNEETQGDRRARQLWGGLSQSGLSDPCWRCIVPSPIPTGYSSVSRWGSLLACSADGDTGEMPVSRSSDGCNNLCACIDTVQWSLSLSACLPLARMALELCMNEW